MPTKARILQVIKTLNVGGAERFGLELSRSLDPRLFEVQVCVFFHENTPLEKYWFEKMTDCGIPVWFAAEWQGNNHFGSYLTGFYQMNHHLKEWHVDIIHSHFQLGTLAGLIERMLGNTKYLLRTAHNHSRKEWETGLYGWLRYQIFSQWLYPILVDAEVGVSSAIVTELNHHKGRRFARRPPRVIYNAIPPDFLDRAQQYPKTKKDAKMWVVGSIGRLMEQKGYIYLLDAIPSIVAVLPDVEFWLIGDGDQRKKLENLAVELHIKKYVRFLGMQVDIPFLLRQMDLFVLPSLWEGLPTVIMESMAAEIPVVTTDIPGNRELVLDGQSGWLVPPKNSVKLAERIISVLQNAEDRASVIENALARLKPFQIDRVAEQYTSLYRELLDQ